MCDSKCGGKCTLSMVCKVLLVVGGINWGLVGIGMLAGQGMSWNVVNMILGSWSVLEAIVYVLVGISAIMSLTGCKCKKCKDACGSCDSGKMQEDTTVGGTEANM